MQPLHQIIFELLWMTVCGYAVVCGGAPERVMGCAIFAAVVASHIATVVLKSPTHPFASVEIGVAVTDGALFTLTVALALTSTRFWPLPMASMLGCELLGHLARPLGPEIVPKAYYAMVAIWGYPTLLLLAVATRRHRVRLGRYGVDYGWTQDLPDNYCRGWIVDEALPDPPRP